MLAFPCSMLTESDFSALTINVNFKHALAAILGLPAQATSYSTRLNSQAGGLLREYEPGRGKGKPGKKY